MGTLKGRRYTFRRFLWDMFMCLITAGLWIIYIIIREVRGR